MLRRSTRRWALALVTFGVLALATAAQSWACASLTLLEVNPTTVKPGDTVAIKVTFVNKDKPVEIRWNALNGPLLTTIEPATFTEGLHGNWRFANGSITVPADAKGGTYVVIASQEAVRGTANWGSPARTIVNVSAGGSAPAVGQTPGPAPEVRPDNLITEKSVSVGDLMIVGLGAAGLTMLLAGMGIVLMASKRRSAPVAAKVQA